MCRKHKELCQLIYNDKPEDSDSSTYENYGDDVPVLVNEGQPMSPEEVTTNQNVLFSLALECSHNLTHSSVSEVIQSVQKHYYIKGLVISPLQCFCPFCICLFFPNTTQEPERIIPVIQYGERATAFKKGKGVKSKSIITIK